MAGAVGEMLMKYRRVASQSLRDDDSDLFAAGLDSFGMVDGIMGAEEEFEVVFTPAALHRRPFATVNTLARVIAGLLYPGRGAAIAPLATDRRVGR